MALISTEALVLRGHKLGETSRIVVLLTRERGKLRAVARGARGRRPRYRSALEPLSEVRVTLYGRQGAELLRLGEAELLRSAFRTSERGLDAALFLSGCAELLDAFCPEGEAEDRVYRLALAVVRAAEAGTNTALLGRCLERAFGVLGHFLMIKAYEVAEAGTIQPFAYFQLVFVSIMGFALFGERPDAWTIAGGALILAAGLYTLVRQARLARRRR